MPIVKTRFRNTKAIFNFGTRIVFLDSSQHGFDEDELPEAVKGFIRHYELQKDRRSLCQSKESK